MARTCGAQSVLVYSCLGGAGWPWTGGILSFCYVIDHSNKGLPSEEPIHDCHWSLRYTASVSLRTRVSSHPLSSQVPDRHPRHSHPTLLRRPETPCCPTTLLVGPMATPRSAVARKGSRIAAVTNDSWQIDFRALRSYGTVRLTEGLSSSGHHSSGTGAAVGEQQERQSRDLPGTLWPVAVAPSGAHDGWDTKAAPRKPA